MGLIRPACSACLLQLPHKGGRLSMILRPSDFGFESIPELRQFIEGSRNETIGEFLERIASHLESDSFAGNRRRASCAMLCFLSNVIGADEIDPNSQSVINRFFRLLRDE
jgi:hypothetical protein